jgi:hypothetical protein
MAAANLRFGFQTCIPFPVWYQRSTPLSGTVPYVLIKRRGPFVCMAAQRPNRTNVMASFLPKGEELWCSALHIKLVGNLTLPCHYIPARTGWRGLPAPSMKAKIVVGANERARNYQFSTL